MFSGLTCKFLIHFEWIFVNGIRKCSNFIPLYVAVQFPSATVFSLRHILAYFVKDKVPISQYSCSVVSNSLQPHGLQHASLPCPSPTLGVCSESCPSSQWWHPAISSSVIPFSSCPQSLPASGSFPMSQLFAWGGQSIGISASASVLPMNIQAWFPLGFTSWISLQSKRLWRVFSNTTVQKLQFFSTQLSLWSNSHIHTWPLEKVPMAVWICLWAFCLAPLVYIPVFVPVPHCLGDCSFVL